MAWPMLVVANDAAATDDMSAMDRKQNDDMTAIVEMLSEMLPTLMSMMGQSTALNSMQAQHQEYGYGSNVA